jgi:choline transport protein
MHREVRDARRNVPKALLSSVLINGLLGWGMMLAILFTMGDLDNILAILTPVTGIPFIDYFYFALGSKSFATGLSALLVSMFIFAAVAIVASTSRTTWAFARDNGLPGSGLLKRVSRPTGAECRSEMLIISRYMLGHTCRSGPSAYQPSSPCC